MILWECVIVEDFLEIMRGSLFKHFSSVLVKDQWFLQKLLGSFWHLTAWDVKIESLIMKLIERKLL